MTSNGRGFDFCSVSNRSNRAGPQSPFRDHVSLTCPAGILSRRRGVEGTPTVNHSRMFVLRGFGFSRRNWGGWLFGRRGGLLAAGADELGLGAGGGS